MTLCIYSQLCEIGCSAFSFCALFSGAGDAIPLCWVFKSASSTADVTPWTPTFHWPGIKLGGSFSAGRGRVQGRRRAQGNGVSLAGTLQSYAGFTQLPGDGWILQQCPSLPNKTLDAGGRPWNEPSHLLEFCKCNRYRVSLMPATTGKTRVWGLRTVWHRSCPLLGRCCPGKVQKQDSSTGTFGYAWYYLSEISWRFCFRGATILWVF